MERCPVCQTPARAGARFCTICGYRLPDDLGQAATPSVESPATDDPSFAVGWPADAESGDGARPVDPYTAGRGPGSGGPGGGNDAAATAAVGSAESEPAPVAIAADEPDAAAPAPSDGSPTTGPPDSDDATPKPPPAPIWRASGEDAPEDSVIAWGAPAPAREPEPTADGSGDEPAAPDHGGDPPADGLANGVGVVADEPKSADSAQPDMPAHPVPAPKPAPAWGFATDADEDPPSRFARQAARPATGPAVATGFVATDPRMRAMALLDEARGLLPLVGGPSFEAGVIAAELEAAAGPADGWADLRIAIAEARSNPSDVGVVLALSRQIDEVIALADAHDRLATVARRAAATLRGVEDAAGDDGEGSGSR
jgi:hypothetical protein